MAGLLMMGFANSLLLHAHLGSSSWTVFADGLSRHLDITVGSATFLISTVVFLLWIPIKQRPGIGTILNIVVTAVAVDVGYAIFPDVNGKPFLQGLYIFCAILLGGGGGALYITCRLGLGPSDGLAIGVNEKYGVSISRIRLSSEVTVLAVGILLGGKFGIGTILVSLFVGGSLAIWLNMIGNLGN